LFILVCLISELRLFEYIFTFFSNFYLTNNKIDRIDRDFFAVLLISRLFLLINDDYLNYLMKL